MIELCCVNQCCIAASAVSGHWWQLLALRSVSAWHACMMGIEWMSLAEVIVKATLTVDLEGTRTC